MRVAATSSAAAPQTGESGIGCLSVKGFAEDATSRELHVLFSGCPGYIKAELALQDGSNDLHAIVQFDKAESAMQAAQARRGTSWEAGGAEVLIDILSSEAGARLVSAASIQNNLIPSVARAPSAVNGSRKPPGAIALKEREAQEEAAQKEAQKLKSPRIPTTRGVGSGTRSITPPRAAVVGHRSVTPPPTGRGEASAYRSVTPPPTGRGEASAYRSVTPPRSREAYFGAPISTAGGAERPRDVTPPRVAPSALKGRRQESPVRSDGEDAGRSAGRNAYIRQIQRKVNAAAERGKLDELEAIVAEAEAAGLDESELVGARQVLASKTTYVTRHRAIHAESRARAKLTELLITYPLEEKLKKPEAIQALDSSIKLGREAYKLCGEAGLKSKEQALRKFVHDTITQWRQTCVARVHMFVALRDMASLRAILMELEVAGLAESVETRPLLEAARRICNGTSSFEDEEKLSSARVVLNAAIATKRAPQLRRALVVMKESNFDDYEIERAQKVFEQAQAKVNARWGVMFSQMMAKTSTLFDLPPHMSVLREAITFAESAGLSGRELQESKSVVLKMDQLQVITDKIHRAMQTKDISELQQAIGESQDVGLQDNQLAKQMIERAIVTLEDEAQKVGVKKKLEAAMSGRRTLAIQAMPSIIKQAEEAGFQGSLLVNAEQYHTKAKAKKRLEEAMKSKETWGLRIAIAEAKQAELSANLIGEASTILEEAELRAEIDFAVQRGDAANLERVMEVWRKKGFDESVLRQASRSLKHMEATTKTLKAELERALAVPIAFEDYKSTIAVDGFPTVRAVADVLMVYPEISIQIDGHGAQKNDNVAKKLSTERATAVKDALLAMGVTNVMSTKGWGNSHPEIKTKKLIRIYPR